MTRPDPLEARSSRSQELRSLCEHYWHQELGAQPLWATFLGVHDHDDRVEDLSAAADERRRGELLDVRDRLDAVEGTLTDEADEVTAALLRHQVDVAMSAIDLRTIELASDHMEGPHASMLMVAAQLDYPEPAHAEAALTRYAQIPALLGQAIDRFRSGLAFGRTPSSAVIARTLSTLDAYLEGSIDQDPFLAAGLPESWSGAAAWTEEAAVIISSRVRPAFASFRDVVATELAPASRDDDHAGWCWLPDGVDLYAEAIRSHTTVDVSAEELHELGRRLCEVDLPAEFSTVATTAFGDDGFSGITELFDRLRGDASLRHSDADEVLAIARSSVERAAAQMPHWFGRLPEAQCRVQAIPDFLASDAPYAYYFPPSPDGIRPGTYFINTADPQGSSRTEAESIAFHEAIPGHHLQIAIGQELDDLPDFQRHTGSTSYVEGWGLYAERLADEMGLYTSDLDRLGMLTADAWRSARLVVDTGLHALGWSRQQAIDYFIRNTPVPVEQIAAEVDRYLAMPGQALAYKVGQLEIERLRADASARLGSHFDVSSFHDVVLGSGAVTLPVLAEMVGRWVERLS